MTDSNLNTKTCNRRLLQKLHKLTISYSCATDYQLSIRQELILGVEGSWNEGIKSSGPDLIHSFSGLDPVKRYHYQLMSSCGTVSSSSY